MKILGLDLGTNSIGWAVVESENKEIIDTGVRIFPEGVSKNSSGKEVSKNAARRIARGTRRRNYRFKVRRDKLIRALKRCNMLPGDKHYSYKKNDQKNHTIELFKLRKEALDKQIGLEDIGRIFLQINNHRGFKSNKKEDAVIRVDKEKEKEAEGVKGTIKKLKKRIDEYGCRTIGEYYNFLIEQNRNSYNPNEPKKISADDKIRGEGAYTSRELFEEEFDLIWEKQKEYYPKIFTEENEAIIKDDCIFYQRDLRSAKHLRNRCTLEYKKYFSKEKEKYIFNYLPCSPKSSFEFQEYRIWEQLNKLRYTNSFGTHQELLLEQKKTLARRMHVVEKLNLTAIKEILGFERNTKFNDIGDHLKGNVTQARLIDALNEDFWFNQTNLDEAKEFEPLKYSQIQYQLWHNIEFSKDKKWLLDDKEFIKKIHKKNERQANRKKKEYKSHKSWSENINKLGLSNEQIEKYANITFEPGWANYSSKAIMKLLKYMKQGYDPINASFEVYGDYASKLQNENIQLENKVPHLANNSIKNPVVEQSVRDTIKVINAVIDKYGKPDKIHIEMSRELKMPKKAREEIRNRNATKDKVREEYARFLTAKLNRNIDKTSPDIKKFEMFLELNYTKVAFEGNIKGQISSQEIRDFFKLKIPSDKTKYYLWLECDRKEPYEGNTINLYELFSPSVEIEHIIPYSICGDDSFLNKTLSFKEFNAKKGKKTPMQYFEDKPNERKVFEKCIAKSHFSDAKRERFLMPTNKIDKFRNSQLNNTAYIGTEVRKHLLKSFLNKDIEITNGRMTSYVRRFLGFDGILNESVQVPEFYQNMGKVWAVINDKREIIDYLTREDDSEPNNVKVIKGVINYQTFYPSKLRDDHRHHAVDALVTALINRKISNSILSCTDGYIDINTGEYHSKYFTDEKGKHRLTREALAQIKEKLKEELSLSELDELLPKAKEKIKHILVSYKNEKLNSLVRKKLFEPNGKPKTINKNGKIYQLKSSGLGVRHELHKSNFYGKTKDCLSGEYVKRIKISELSYKQIINIIDKKIQRLIVEKIGKFALLEITKDDSLDENLKSLDSVMNTIWLDIQILIIDDQIKKIKKEKGKENLVKRKELKFLLSEVKQKLPEKGNYIKIKKAIAYGLKQASKEGFFLENEGKRKKRKGVFESNIIRYPIPIKKVRVKFKLNTAIPVKSEKQIVNVTPLSQVEIRKDKFQFIEPSNNYSIVIYGDLYNENGKPQREKHIVTWFEKARIDVNNIKNKKQEKELFPYYPSTKKELPFLCQLSHNDLVVMFENDPNEIIWNNKDEIFTQLFVVVKFTQDGEIRLKRHNKANVNADKGPWVNKDELSLGEGAVLSVSPNSFRGIPVKIDVLGNIVSPFYTFEQ